MNEQKLTSEEREIVEGMITRLEDLNGMFRANTRKARYLKNRALDIRDFIIGTIMGIGYAIYYHYWRGV